MRMKRAVLAFAAAFAIANGTAAAEKAPSAYAAEIGASKAAMVAQPQAAYEHARRADALALQATPSRARDLDEAAADWLTGESLIRLKRPKDAEPILDRALVTVRRAAPGVKLNGDLLRSRGAATAALGDVQSALSDFLAAFHIYQQANEPRSEAMVLQDVASMYSDARDYDHVLAYSRQSNEVYSSDPSITMIAHNNLGFAFKDLKRYPEAEAEFQKALLAADQIGSGYLKANILTNVAMTQELRGQHAAARQSIAQGLQLAQEDPEAAGEKPSLYGVLAKIDFDSGDAAAAAALLARTFKGVDLAKSSMDFRDFHELASKVYEKTGDSGLEIAHLKAFKRLDDQGRALAASTNAALMSAKFDFANQDLKIARLKAGELERDVKLARSQARLRAVILCGLLLAGGASLAVTLVGFLSMRASRNRIRAANAELGVSNTALEKALKAKTEFLATTSHEIRTPLNGILGMTQIMLADGDIKGGVRERLQLVKGASETMKSLVDDLLDVAKAENGEVTLHPQTMDLQRVLNDTCAFWLGQAEAKGLDLSLDGAAAPRFIVADEARLRQVLFNLMSNAVKFTSSGSVVLHAAAVGDELVLRVVDTGLGIAANEHERIFEPFTQVDSGATRQFGGTGLGLSICRNISSAMSGRVDVESCEGGGSTFTLTTPLVVAEAPAAVEQAHDLATAAVLVVDPNPLAQSILKVALGAAATSVTTVALVDEGLDYLQTARADLVLVDGAALNSLGVGLEAALHRIIDAAQGAHIVVTWPQSEAEAVDALKTAGARMVVLKPVSPVALISQLATAWTKAPSLGAMAAAA